MKPQGAPRLSIQPVILIEPETLETIRYFVAQNSKECHWFHQVEKFERNGCLIYRVHDFLVPEQVVSSATVETEGPGMQQSWKNIQEARSLSLQELGEIISNTACWCHSHVNMGTSPSGVDNAQWRKQKDLSAKGLQTGPQMMMIFNKNDSYFNRVWDPELRVEFENVPLVMNVEIDHAAIDALIKSRITVRKLKVYMPKRPGYQAQSISDIMSSGGWDDNLGKKDQKKNNHQTEKSSKELQTDASSVASSRKNTDNEEEQGFLDDLTYGMISTLCTQLNETPNLQRSAVITKELMGIVNNCPIVLREADYAVLDTLIFGSVVQINKLGEEYFFLDSILDGQNWPEKQFIEHCMTETFEPSDILAEALETLGELQISTTNDEIEQVLEDWIARILECEIDNGVANTTSPSGD